MTIGSLGDVVFKIDDKTMQTFTELNWDSKASYSKHSRHMKKQLVELTGFEADEVSFTMTLSAYLGVNPEKMLKKLENLKNTGAVNTLVLGTTVIGSKWVVEQIKRKVQNTYKDGTLVSCEVTVTLLEYPER